MESSLGWTLLSREALKRAETQLREDTEGVRDEIGFLALHQHYADRFFPGTSVLHTRLRYALFVPWMYQRMIERGERHRVDTAVEKHEVVLAGRLKKSNEEGIIGGRSYPKPTAQPPTMVYWTALGAWRILRRLPDGSHPSRSSVHRMIALRVAGLRLHDDDHQLLSEDEALFARIPPHPDAWLDPNAPLDFRLTGSEAKFLRGCLLAVARPNTEATPSLLARLVGVRLDDDTELSDSKIFRVADADDRVALRRAAQAAALSAVGRGAYAALVERIREETDRIPTEKVHRKLLPNVIDQYRGESLQLDIDQLALEMPGSNRGIIGVLRETQNWLKGARGDVRDLHRTYQTAELARKEHRARLAMTLAGRRRRAEWVPKDLSPATPLHYRWSNVRRLLIDLQSAP